MTPLLGEAFFTSAINPGFPVLACASLIAPMKSRLGGANFSIMDSREMGCLSLIFSISTALYLGGTHGIGHILPLISVRMNARCDNSGNKMQAEQHHGPAVAATKCRRLHQTISSSMLRGLLSSDCMTLKSTGPHLNACDEDKSVGSGATYR